MTSSWAHKAHPVCSLQSTSVPVQPPTDLQAIITSCLWHQFRVSLVPKLDPLPLFCVVNCGCHALFSLGLSSQLALINCNQLHLLLGHGCSCHLMNSFQHSAPLDIKPQFLLSLQSQALLHYEYTKYYLGITTLQKHVYIDNFVVQTISAMDQVLTEHVLARLTSDDFAFSVYLHTKIILKRNVKSGHSCPVFFYSFILILHYIYIIFQQHCVILFSGSNLPQQS